MRFSGGGTFTFLDAATTIKVSPPTTSFTVACSQPLAILQGFISLLHCTSARQKLLNIQIYQIY